MLVAVLSDCHDNIWNLQKVLAEVRGAEAAIFCGDFCAPFSLKMLADGFSGPVHAVLGNNDGDIYLLLSIAEKSASFHLHRPVGLIELGGRNIAIAHYPEVGEALARSGQYDAVFSGHTHRSEVQTIGTTLWANPGEVMGRFGRPSYGLYDTAQNHMVLHSLS
jgi:putative phosphoesterase